MIQTKHQGITPNTVPFTKVQNRDMALKKVLNEILNCTTKVHLMSCVPICEAFLQLLQYVKQKIKNSLIICMISHEFDLNYIEIPWKIVLNNT